MGDSVQVSAAPEMPGRSAAPPVLSSGFSRWMTRLGTSLLVVGSLAGPVAAAGLAPLPVIDEAQEQLLVGGTNRPAQLVSLASGRPGAGATFTIHGANGKPDDMRFFGESAQRQGQEVQTLAYDDMMRRLSDNSRDLANHLVTWMKTHPSEPVNLNGYCMGGRIVLGALAQLQKEGQLDERPITVTLLAPLLEGVPSANWSRLDPGGLFGTFIPGVRIGYDMATSSDFQATLEGLKLPENVTTKIYIGDRDEVVDRHHSRFQTIAKNLNAEVVVLPEVDHNNIVYQGLQLK